MTIGIIGAMDKEIANILEDMNVLTTRSAIGLEFYLGTLSGSSNSIVLVRSGIGKVNAALCAQVLIDLFAVDEIINVGVAGGMASDMKVGDIVVSTEAMYHDFDTSPLGDEVGYISGIDTSIFAADASLIEACENAIKDLGLKYYTGRIVSGDQFIADSNIKNRIKTLFNSVCCEMEGAAIAHCCHLNKIPFVVIRAISDNADDEGDVNYEEFSTKAAHTASEIIKNMVSHIK
ncbi:MAG: 5'-methylthioadenosine/adenosylhomocysteine nucleosidase [Lachnospirales bacterium]